MNKVIDATNYLKIINLRCEYLHNPVGIETSIGSPRLSWKIASLDDSIRGIRQTAYRILVAESIQKLNDNCGDLWDSGRIESENSLQIAYAGKELLPRQRCYWKVQIWDKKECLSAWSEPAFWSMGLREGDWKAKWIGYNKVNPKAGDAQHEADQRRLPARMLRHEFALDQSIRRATAFISGLGYSELYLNGQKVSNRIMDPTHTNADQRVFYVTHDVTDLLHEGENAVGVILGNGRFYAPRIKTPVDTPSFGFPRLLFQMHIEYKDGSCKLVLSDEQWKVTDEGPIRANNEYDGEEYDARMELDGWDCPDFDDSDWAPAELIGFMTIAHMTEPVTFPGPRIMAHMHEPMRVIEAVKPVKITQPSNAVHLVDFGQNLYGMVRIKISGPRGARVSIRTSFDLNDDGLLDMRAQRSARSTDVYILKGEGEEVWAPRFRGQGTRYAEITGWPGEISCESVELLVVHSDMTKTGEFECANPLVNQIYDNLVRSVRMQERGLPMDPDRDERQAWLGVCLKTSETEAYLYDTAAFHTNWLVENRISNQREDGCLSDAGHLWKWGYTGDACWGSDVVFVPLSCYAMYGDRRILEENYGMMKRWLDFLWRRIDPDLIYRKAFYGDWVDASTMDLTGLSDKDNGTTPREFLSTAFIVKQCADVSHCAQLLGFPDDAQVYKDRAVRVRKAFNREFFNAQTGKYGTGSQCCYILALAFGLVPQESRSQVIENLRDEIMVNCQGHLSIGSCGSRFIMQTLTECGLHDVAYTILTKRTRPGWGYMVEKGATSIWERWDGDTRDPEMNGQSQMILAGYLGAWLFRYLAGIKYDCRIPGFKRLLLEPQPVGDLTAVKASYNSHYGLIVSDWNLLNGVFHWKIEIPPNVEAVVTIPSPSAKRGPLNLTIGSGRYEITYDDENLRIE